MLLLIAQDDLADLVLPQFWYFVAPLRDCWLRDTERLGQCAPATEMSDGVVECHAENCKLSYMRAQVRLFL